MNCNTFVLCLIFGLTQGTQNAIGTIMGLILNTLGFKSTVVNITGICFVLGALIGCWSLGFILSCFPKYKLIIVMLCLTSALSIFALGQIGEEKLELAMYPTTFIAGISLCSMAVPIYDLAVETNFPLGESYSNTILNMTAQIFTIVIVEIQSEWIDENKIDGFQNCYISYIAMLISALFLSFFVRQRLLRKEAEDA